MPIKLNTASGGGVILQGANTASDKTITIPATDGTVATQEYVSGVATGFGFKNRIINGDMRIDQRNNGASVTPTANAYTLDRWQAINAGVASKFSVQRSTVAPAGFANSLLVTSLSAYSVTSTDRFAINQNIEGFNFADFGWGSSAAQPATISFYVRSSLTGTFGGCFENGASNRSYPFSYTINSANTWEQKTVTVPGDTTGTWATDNTIGLQVYFGLGVGSTFSGTAGSWQAADLRSATGAVSVVGTNGATFYITGVQLEKGSTATSFDYRPYGTELALCQRYYAKTFPQSIAPAQAADSSLLGLTTGAVSGTNWYGTAHWTFPVTMRAAPSVTTFNPGAANANFRNNSNNADYAVSYVAHISDTKATIGATNTIPVGAYGVIHATASAEL